MAQKHDHTTEVSGVWTVDEITTPEPDEKSLWPVAVIWLVVGFLLGAFVL